MLMGEETGSSPLGTEGSGDRAGSVFPVAVQTKNHKYIG